MDAPPPRRSAPVFASLVLVVLLVHGETTADEVRSPIIAAEPIWSASSGQFSAHFGRSLNNAGDVNRDGYEDLIVGTPRWSAGPNTFNHGKVSLFLGGPGGLEANPSWEVEGTQEFEYLGSVGPGGDFNGDGFFDVIVGASSFDGSAESQGRAYVYLGSEGGLSLVPAWVLDPETPRAQGAFGWSVGGAGDVNGDGLDEMYVAEWDRLFLFMSPAAGETPELVWSDSDAELLAVAAADVDGDGFGDLLVGTPGVLGGRARLFRGGPTGLSSVASWTVDGSAGEQVGRGIAGGDVDGDGYDDAIVGSTGFSDNTGKVVIYRGGDGGLATEPSWTIEGTRPFSDFGSPVATADVNGDGHADILVGETGYDSPRREAGRALAFLGSADGPELTPTWSAGGSAEFDDFGWAVSGIDTNGDGFGDVIVGSPDSENGPPDEGEAFAYLGSSGGVVPVARCDIEPPSLNVDSQSSAFSITTQLINLWSGDPMDPSLLGPVHISRVSAPRLGTVLLPVPSTDPGCDDATEDGIWETYFDRTLSGNGSAVLRFSTPSDGLCVTADGNKEDLVALLAEVPDGEAAEVCFTGAHPMFPGPVQCCAEVTVRNRRVR